MTLYEVLKDIKDSARSRADQGAKFERLIRSWLLSDPYFSSELAEVWLWRDFPARKQFGGNDLGIDLVAKTNTGLYYAFQCKFYAETTHISKADVDSFISNSGRTFTDPETHQETRFCRRYLVYTNERLSANAEETFRNQDIPVNRLNLATLLQSRVDWGAVYRGVRCKKQVREPYDHQKEAVKKAVAHFASHDRGKLIMACGTGKTFTANLIASKLVPEKGAILCLVPSISLVNQFLNNWFADTDVPTTAICICSDPQANRGKNDEPGDSLLDLAQPSSTSPDIIAGRYLDALKKMAAMPKGHIVIFSTYQSIDAVAAAQKRISDKLGEDHSFDLVICDEAHRTTGIIKPGEGKSDFTKVHDNTFIAAKKRLYMTATPRLYADNLKVKASQSDYELCSMDDKALYGEEFHRVGFGYAIANNLLTDYKVLVLTVGSDYQLPADIRQKVRNPEDREYTSDFACRLVGCINGLAKNTVSSDNALVWDADPGIMRRAIAFCPNINKKGDPASSTNTARELPRLSESVSFPDDKHRINIQAQHVDGSMDSADRAGKLAWLSEPDLPENECRVLCNVRCLSEGIDVPALDAAIFLSPRNSQIEVVQAVGRVMRNFHRGQSDEKKYGYIIIPIVVNPNVAPEDALNDNVSFSVLWSVLNALRSHDERFNAIINSIALNNKKPENIVVDTVRFYEDAPEGDTDFANENEARYASDIASGVRAQLRFFDNIGDHVYARMVQKVGSRLYWERWAADIAPIVRNLIGRITDLVQGDLEAGFNEFLAALRASINESVSAVQAIEMLGQHMITRPVFEALFTDYAFDDNNAVTRAMNAMTSRLLAAGLAKDTAVLDKFYESVKTSLGSITTLQGRQTVIKNLYESFFRGAFPLAVEQLGIVYTPVECVDFILASVDWVLRNEFGIGLTDRGVHILDPFAGTGTFITRLLQSGLIRREDLKRKYLQEIHCNEIVLLAYYVADVNIESVFHDVYGGDEYLKYDGICLTDTFTLSQMATQPELMPFLKENFESIENEIKAPIRVIVGNPPYSAGQKSGNDNARNLKYPALDKRIEETYVAMETGVNKKNLYDSYIRAFRWASDRLAQTNESGVIGFITNGGWLDGNAAAGFRKCLVEEFSSIYVLHLRGDQRTSGELSRKEGGKIFGAGSRAPAVITILVYNPNKNGPGKIWYADIGDYLTREQKLKILADRRNIAGFKDQWRVLIPDEHGDWLKQRSGLFESFIPIGDKKEKARKDVFFEPIYSLGLGSNRDSWVYNFSKEELEKNIKSSIRFYNEQCEVLKNGGHLIYDPTRFSWTDPTRAKVQKGIKFSYDNGEIVTAMYRPFCKEYLYFSKELNHRPGKWPSLFPTPKSENLVICISGLGGNKEFTTLITDKIPDLNMLDAGAQCFPLYYYHQKKDQQGSLLGDDIAYEKKYAITDWILKTVRSRFGNASSITKETIFYYVYGLLHSPDYRARFSDDLKKILPHIPIVEKPADFMAYAKAGERLAALHTNYESAAHCPEVIMKGADKGNYIVEKMRFGGKAGGYDRTTIIYNADITISNIPLAAYEYVVNGRSAIEWIMETCRVKTDSDSGITNNPNAWAAEHGRPDYILNLLLAIIGLSLKTREIVEELPKLEFERWLNG